MTEISKMSSQAGFASLERGTKVEKTSLLIQFTFSIEVCMYKMCDRCRFNVPAKQATCQVCGSHVFVSQQEPSRKPLVSAESVENCRAGIEQASGKVQALFSTLAKEIGETAGKMQRAADNMRKLIFDAGNEDRVMTFHRNVGSGRSVDFIPVFQASHSEPEAVSKNVRSKLISDDRVFAPKFDFVELRVVQNQLTNLSATFESPDEVADIEELRKQISDLTGWFKEFGKEGLLIKSELSAVATADDGSKSEESRQAA